MGARMIRAASSATCTGSPRPTPRPRSSPAKAGFDAVEIHFGHNYLVSSFLSPRLNRREDDYGGSLANRARLARDVGRAVRDAVGDQLAVTAKLNMDDGVPGGFWLDESIQVAQWLEADGSVDALELTAGSSLLNPMYLFTGDAPIREFAAQFPPPVRLALQASGNRFLRSYPYQEAYLLDRARQFRAALRLPLILLGGITGKETMDLAMAEGFAFVAMARALLREPDLVQRIQADPAPGRCASTATSACPRSTAARTACSRPLSQDHILDNRPVFSAAAEGAVSGADSSVRRAAARAGASGMRSGSDKMVMRSVPA